MEDLLKKLGIITLLLALLAFTSVFVAIALSFASDTTVLGNGNVAVIPVTGVIMNGEDTWSTIANPDDIIAWIEDADADPNVQAIVLEINSPGGSPVASDEISQAVLRANKTVVARIRDTGASGAYWVASSSDYIIANRMSLTGSVGVTGSYVEWAGTLRRYNATYREFTGGERKELANPFDDLTPSEAALFQAKIDLLHDVFTEHVAERRNLTQEQRATVRTGEPFLGLEAIELGLVDELGGQYELDTYLEELLGEEPAYVHYSAPKTLLEEFGLVSAPRQPRIEDVLASDVAYTGGALRT